MKVILFIVIVLFTGLSFGQNLAKDIGRDWTAEISADKPNDSLFLYVPKNIEVKNKCYRFWVHRYGAYYIVTSLDNGGSGINDVGYAVRQKWKLKQGRFLIIKSGKKSIKYAAYPEYKDKEIVRLILVKKGVRFRFPMPKLMYKIGGWYKKAPISR